MAIRTILRGGAVLVGLAVWPACGQPAVNLGRSFQPSPQANVSAPAPAPAPRRPPRVVQVPAAAENATGSAIEPQVLDDEALNRKISGICRGC